MKFLFQLFSNVTLDGDVDDYAHEELDPRVQVSVLQNFSFFVTVGAAKQVGPVSHECFILDKF
jgi:hypothetical protein